MQIIDTRHHTEPGCLPLVMLTVSFENHELASTASNALDHLQPTVVREGLNHTVMQLSVRAATTADAITHLTGHLGTARADIVEHLIQLLGQETVTAERAGFSRARAPSPAMITQ